MSERSFRELFVAHESRYVIWEKVRVEYEAGYTADLAVAYKKFNPKGIKGFKNKPYQKAAAQFAAIPEGERKAILDMWQPKADKFKAQFRLDNEAREKKMDELAVILMPWKTDYFTKVYVCSDNVYRSQGWEASRYAKADAQRKLDKCLKNNIPAHLVIYSYKIDQKHAWTEFQVWAQTDDAGFEVIQRKVESLKDFIQKCWKQGVNPRVYNPFIPVGMEEKLGLDYFGGVTDLKK